MGNKYKYSKSTFKIKPDRETSYSKINRYFNCKISYEILKITHKL